MFIENQNTREMLSSRQHTALSLGLGVRRYSSEGSRRSWDPRMRKHQIKKKQFYEQNLSKNEQGSQRVKEKHLRFLRYRMNEKTESKRQIFTPIRRNEHGSSVSFQALAWNHFVKFGLTFINIYSSYMKYPEKNLQLSGKKLGLLA